MKTTIMVAAAVLAVGSVGAPRAFASLEMGTTIQMNLFPQYENAAYWGSFSLRRSNGTYASVYVLNDKNLLPGIKGIPQDFAGRFFSMVLVGDGLGVDNLAPIQGLESVYWMTLDSTASTWRVR